MLGTSFVARRAAAESMSVIMVATVIPAERSECRNP
jgi:hypothetical protein